MHLNLNVVDEINVHVGRKGIAYCVSISRDYYQMLKENGRFAARYEGPSNKISIVEESFANKDDDLRFQLFMLRRHFKNP